MQTSTQLDTGMFIAAKYKDELFLCKIKSVDHLTQELQLLWYEPSFPGTIFYVSRSKNRNNVNIHVEDIVLVLRYNPVLGKQDEIHLNHKQFTDIKSICEEF
jgi:hypothetical protein